MIWTYPDVWTHILSHCDYKDIRNLRRANKEVGKLFEHASIKSLIKSKYVQYKQHIQRLMIHFLNQMVDKSGRVTSIYFKVTDINFKLYRKTASDEFIHLEDYQSDLHFYCNDPFWYDEDFGNQTPKRSIFIDHQSSCNTDPKLYNDKLKSYEKEIYVQIDSSIADYLTNPSYLHGNKDKIYPARKYPVSESSEEWSDPDDDFRNQHGPLDNFWPLDIHETKTIDSYTITEKAFVELLSHIYNQIEKCWIVSYKNLDDIIDKSYSDLLPYIYERSIINAADEDYSQPILKFEKFN